MIENNKALELKAGFVTFNSRSINLSKCYEITSIFQFAVGNPGRIDDQNDYMVVHFSISFSVNDIGT